jgi:putative endonuclease
MGDRKSYYIYIMTSRTRRMYTGLTNNLVRRVFEHKSSSINGFSKKYRTTRLVYFEEIKDIQSAIAREKQIKSWRRSKKIDLIESLNPEWRDLSEAWDLF